MKKIILFALLFSACAVLLYLLVQTLYNSDKQSPVPKNAGNAEHAISNTEEVEPNQQFTEFSESHLISKQQSQYKTQLIFQSGFEADTRIVDQDKDDAKIIGRDHTMAVLSDWTHDLEEHPKIGYFNFQYQGGDSSQRLAEIVTDPLNQSNNVLKFWLREPNVDKGAGRVQANVYNNNGIRELDFSVRLLIPGDFNTLQQAPFKIEWLTLMEFWNNANWTKEAYPFRITLNLQKLSRENDAWRIGLKSQVRNMSTSKWKNPHLWEYINNDYEVPVGEWITLKIHFVEGDRDSGKFKLNITEDNEVTTEVLDITNSTHHPNDPSPDGLSHFNPMKLYTSDKVIYELAKKDKLLNVYWDDFRIALAPSP